MPDSQISELIGMAIKFETQAMVLRRVAAELGHVSHRNLEAKGRLLREHGKRHMSAAAKAIISKKLRAAWKVRKQIKEAK